MRRKVTCHHEGGVQLLAASHWLDMECPCPPFAPATVVQRPDPTSEPVLPRLDAWDLARHCPSGPLPHHARPLAVHWVRMPGLPWKRYVQLWSCPGAWKARPPTKLVFHQDGDEAPVKPEVLLPGQRLVALYPIMRHYPHGCAALEAPGLPGPGHAFGPGAPRNHVWGHNQAQLQAAAENAIQSFQEADFGVPLMKKWHWLLHMPDFLQKHGNLPSTFTTERKHKTISAFATRLQKTSAFECRRSSASHGNHHFEGARSVSRHLSVGQTKEAQQEATPSLAELRGCPRQRHHGCFKCQARQGWCHPQPRCRGLPPRRRKLADRPSLLPPGPRRPESCTLLQRWSPSEVHKMAHYAKCSINNEHGFVPIDSIQYPLLYNKDTEQEATVLHPVPAIQQALKNYVLLPSSPFYGRSRCSFYRNRSLALSPYINPI